MPSVAVFSRCAIRSVDDCFSDGDLEREVKTSERRSVLLRRQASSRSSRGEAPCVGVSAGVRVAREFSEWSDGSVLYAWHLHTSSPILSLCSGFTILLVE
jgi:hypothetical protein